MEDKIIFNGEKITEIQIIAILLKLIGVPYFAEASWITVFSPTIITLAIFVVILIIYAIID